MLVSGEASMFLRRYSRTKEGKTHTYYALVESVRTEAGPRQHVVAYLGELNDDQVSAPDDPDVVRIRLGSVGWTNARRFGDIWLGLWLWKLLDLDAIVDR